MTTYTSVFGGANIYPSEITFADYALTADVTLSWPLETSAAENFATRIIEVSQDAAGYYLILPPADQTGTGQTILFNNIGSYTFGVKDADGVEIMSCAPGTVWQTYLTDNTTTAGVWATFQYGASISSANAAALAGIGLIAIGSTLSQSMPVSTYSTNYTATSADRSTAFVWTGAGSGTLTLPDPAVVGNNWFMNVRNSGGGALDASAGGLITIDGLSTLSFQPDESAIIITDGASYYTIGFGQSATFAFDYTSVNVAGTGTYTLSGSELNRIAYSFTGLLTGDREVIVPSTVQQYWVDNSTTGAYNFTLNTATGVGQIIAQGQRGIFYCNGSDIVDADTASISLPVLVAQGGTGATTASSARANLGATSVGDAVFTATTAAIARGALGSSVVGDAIFIAATAQDVLVAIGPISGGTF